MTSPDYQEGNPSLRGDVRLVKAALLYADEVELLGLSANMVHAIGLAPGSKSLSLSELVDLVEATGNASLPPNIRDLLPVFEAVSKGELVLPDQLQEGAGQVAEFVTHANELLGPAQTDILNSTGAEELRPALASGILSVADLGVGMSDAVAAAAGTGTNSDRAIQQWIDEIKVRLRDGCTRLLFDEGSGDLVQSMFDEGVIAPDKIGLRLADSAALGAGFVARLPALAEAPMDELLDLRAELDFPLTRYRGAMARFAAGLAGTIPGVAEVSAKALLGQKAGSASARRHDMFYLYKLNARFS